MFKKNSSYPLLLFLFILLFSYSFSQTTVVIDSLSGQVNRLSYANKYDSAQTVVLNFLERKALSALETFYANYFLGDILKSSGKNKEAIEQFSRSKELLREIPQKNKYESLVNSKIAEAYFNVLDYSNAKKFAQLSIRQNPDSSLRSEGHAVNYIILGYADYVERKYESALSYYGKAIAEYKRSNSGCELPLCYMKIAKVLNAQKKEKEAAENLRQAISLSDSCGIEQYKLLSLYTELDIDKENKNYVEALSTLEEINRLVEKIGFEKQRQLMTEMEVKYQTKLAQNENENQRIVNEKNEKIVLQQKTVLVIAFFGVLILLVLIVLLFV